MFLCTEILYHTHKVSNREYDGLWSRVVTVTGRGLQISTLVKPAPVARV
jgi:hypothetical protein